MTRFAGSMAHVCAAGSCVARRVRSGGRSRDEPRATRRAAWPGRFRRAINSVDGDDGLGPTARRGGYDAGPARGAAAAPQRRGQGPAAQRGDRGFRRSRRRSTRKPGLGVRARGAEAAVGDEEVAPSAPGSGRARAPDGIAATPSLPEFEGSLERDASRPCPSWRRWWSAWACKGLGAQLLEDDPSVRRKRKRERARPSADVAVARPQTTSTATPAIRWPCCSSTTTSAGAGVHHAVRQRPRDEPVQPGPAASRHRPRGQARLARARRRPSPEGDVRRLARRLRQCRHHHRRLRQDAPLRPPAAHHAAGRPEARPGRPGSATSAAPDIRRGRMSTTR